MTTEPAPTPTVAIPSTIEPEQPHVDTSALNGGDDDQAERERVLEDLRKLKEGEKSENDNQNEKANNDNAEKHPENDNDKPKAKAEKVDNSMAIRLRAREREQKRREEIAKKEAELSERTRLFAIEQERVRAQLERTSQEEKRYRDFFQNLERNPIEAVREHGLNYDKLTQDILTHGTPEARVAALEQKFEQETKAMKEFFEKQAQARQAEDKRRTEVAFCRKVVEDKYPAIHAIFGDDPEDLIETAYKVQNRALRETGHQLSDDEILDLIEKRFRRVQNAHVDHELASTASAESALRAGKANGNRTLSATKASVRATAPRHDEDLSLDPDEERARAIAAVRAAMKG